MPCERCEKLEADLKALRETDAELDRDRVRKTEALHRAEEHERFLRGLLQQKQAEIRGKTAALRSIALNSCCGSCQEAAMVARKALRPAAEHEPTGVHGKLICDGQICAYCGVQHRTAAPQESAPKHHCGLTGWNPMKDEPCPACRPESASTPSACADRAETIEETHARWAAGSEQPDHAFRLPTWPYAHSSDCVLCREDRCHKVGCGLLREAHRRRK